ncbi:hypothetical protein [Novosphingobium sp. TCA1]|uniref:hypothetical protein n=1 Tax=Novosphingobium sp. TCA1 TaxID=2682474 RepID=UPI00130AD464|nr:hypothetical protein [Novosphingobium sp. TCA1]GFE76595.1 hypothetical protein NTCA1_42440 [Novosphingobium sp. TCA1]
MKVKSQAMAARSFQIEKALLQFEGAIFCMRDIVAQVLVQTPGVHADTMIQQLADRAHMFAEQLGPERLTGYIDELQMFRTEIGEIKVPTEHA